MKSTNYALIAGMLIMIGVGVFLYGMLHRAGLEGAVIAFAALGPACYYMMKAERAEASEAAEAANRRLVKFN